MKSLFKMLGVIPLLALSVCEPAESAYDRGNNDGYAV